MYDDNATHLNEIQPGPENFSGHFIKYPFHTDTVLSGYSDTQSW